MKKNLLLAVSFALTALSVQAGPGDDITAKYLKNANFTADAPTIAGIRTYAKDIAVGTNEKSGMQPVAEWNASNPVVEDATDIDARAAGIYQTGAQYAIDITGNEEDEMTELFLGGTGYLAPTTNPAGEESKANILGMVAVWGATMSYTQPVTLPAGAYEIHIPVYNGGGETAVAANKFGFIANNGTSYTATNTTWAPQVWDEMVITFMLSEETSGVISLGYNAANVGSAAMPHLYLSEVKILEGDPKAIDRAAAEELLPELLELIEAGEEMSLDVSASQAVYDNPNSTLAEVQAAIEAQKIANQNAMTDFTDFFINNAHFAFGTPLDNGVCTYDYDMEKNSTTYYGMQPIQDWTASNPTTNTVEGINNGRASGLFAVGSPENVWLGSVEDKVPATKANGATEGNLFGFISVWSAQSNYTQSATLPAGSYTITIPYYNERGTGTVSKNLCGFIAENGTEYLGTSTTFPVGKWTNETIKFKLEEETSGYFTIGYTASNAGSGSMPHLYIDEFTLMFNGKTAVDPSLLALNGAVRSAENYLYNIEDKYEQALMDSLELAKDHGAELVSESSADATVNTAAATKINNIITQIRASINDYKKFATFVNETLPAALDKYDANADFEALVSELETMSDECSAAYEDATYNGTQIAEAISSLDTKILTATQTAFENAQTDGEEHDIDITILFPDKNLSYANSNVNGWANETGTTAFLSRVQTAEVWNQASFNVSLALDSLPAGVYEINAPGFYRSAGNIDNWTEVQNGNVVGSAYIYANGNKVLMHNVAEYAAANDDNHTAPADNSDAEAATMFVPNSNDNANYIFYKEREAVNSVITALAETGTLTVGVKGENLESQAWVVWGAFTIKYKGTAGMNIPLSEQIADLINEAKELDDEVATMVVEADNVLMNAIGKGEEISSDNEVPEIVEAIETLKDAIAYGKESKKLFADILGTVQVYNDYLMGTVESNDEDFPALIDEINDALSSGFESNKAIEDYKEAIPAAWTRFVQFNALAAGDASENNAYDITGAILNPSFESILGGDNPAYGEYWNKTREGGNDFGYQAGVYESYNTNSFDINQTIKGLATGYYRVKVQGFYRAGTNQENADLQKPENDSIDVHAVILYANSYTTPINNQLENGSEGAIFGAGEEPAIIFGENEEFHVPNNREAVNAQFEADLYWNTVDCYVNESGVLKLGLKKNSHVANDWTPFDNFQLFYLGTEEPTAVESISADDKANTNTVKAIFDLAGRRVNKAVKGIYIINGKKVIK